MDEKLPHPHKGNEARGGRTPETITRPTFSFARRARVVHLDQGIQYLRELTSIQQLGSSRINQVGISHG